MKCALCMRDGGSSLTSRDASIAEAPRGSTHAHTSEGRGRRVLRAVGGRVILVNGGLVDGLRVGRGAGPAEVVGRTARRGRATVDAEGGDRQAATLGIIHVDSRRDHGGRPR